MTAAEFLDTTGFADLDLAAVEVGAVQGDHGGVGFVLAGHLDESETARLALLATDLDGLDLAAFGAEGISPLATS